MTEKTITPSRPVRAAPQLMFDDGSRAMMEQSATASPAAIINPRGGAPIREYYEIDRLCAEIRNISPRNNEESLRVALQLPDELLGDAPDVCWEFEEALGDEILVFCLGDTTYAPCCPDQVAAAHLQADVLVHFGHACLSPCRDIPVYYSFGKTSLAVDTCAEVVAKQAEQDGISRVLVFYELQYQHAMEAFGSQLEARHQPLEVVMGQLPEPAQSAARTPSTCARPDCCSTDSPSASCEKESVVPSTPAADGPESDTGAWEKALDGATLQQRLVIGGLQIPSDMDFSEYALLFVGSESSRQYLNVILRFLSGSSPQCFWTLRPSDARLSVDLSSTFQRKLSRRFYLVQKAKNCAVFGILVANLSDSYMRSVVSSLRKLLEDDGRTSYTFVVGKINPAKLANFAEVDCFVLVACPEHSLLEDEREFPIPVVTPMELSIALGLVEWGSEQYSLDTRDYLSVASTAVKPSSKNGDTGNEDGDGDAPYFSLVTGTFESAPAKDSGETNLAATAGQGQLTTYHSAAADFLKKREYQGLEVQAGLTEVHTAIKGQEGIASDYGDR